VFRSLYIAQVGRFAFRTLHRLEVRSCARAVGGRRAIAQHWSGWLMECRGGSFARGVVTARSPTAVPTHFLHPTRRRRLLLQGRWVGDAEAHVAGRSAPLPDVRVVTTTRE
jgi:hypothetical protein